MTDDRMRQALEAIERDRADSLDGRFTQLPKGTVNMVIDLLRGVLHSEARAGTGPKRHRHRWVDRFGERWECDLCGAVQAAGSRSVKGSDVAE